LFFLLLLLVVVVVVVVVLLLELLLLLLQGAHTLAGLHVECGTAIAPACCRPCAGIHCCCMAGRHK
jgi:hypothetical protein